jgi:hypothetical protein
MFFGDCKSCRRLESCAIILIVYSKHQTLARPNDTSHAFSKRSYVHTPPSPHIAGKDSAICICTPPLKHDETSTSHLARPYCRTPILPIFHPSRCSAFTTTMQRDCDTHHPLLSRINSKQRRRRCEDKAYLPSFCTTVAYNRNARDQNFSPATSHASRDSRSDVQCCETSHNPISCLANLIRCPRRQPPP